MSLAKRVSFSLAVFILLKNTIKNLRRKLPAANVVCTEGQLHQAAT